MLRTDEPFPLIQQINIKGNHKERKYRTFTCDILPYHFLLAVETFKIYVRLLTSQKNFSSLEKFGGSKQK